MRNNASDPVLYESMLQVNLRVDQQDYLVSTKPGIPDWNTLPVQVSLLSRHITIQPDWHILQIGSGHGAGSLFLAQKAHRGKIEIWETNHIARLCTHATLAQNGVTNWEMLQGISLPDRLAGACDAVVMQTPKGRANAQRCLLLAFQALRQGGELYLAGGNLDGIQSLVDDAGDLFGAGTILGYKKGHRLVRFLRGSAANQSAPWMTTPGIAPGTWSDIRVMLAGQEMNLKSLPGIFSYDRLDEGTQFLLENLETSNPLSALDLGCGWGAIGLWAAHRWQRVDMVDTNILATCASQENVGLLGLKNTRVFAADVTGDTPPGSYTHILTNPPFHTGREVEYLTPHAFIQQAARALAPGGELWLVANKFIPYRKIMQQVFSSTRVAAGNSRYQVIVGAKG